MTQILVSVRIYCELIAIKIANNWFFPTRLADHTRESGRSNDSNALVTRTSIKMSSQRTFLLSRHIWQSFWFLRSHNIQSCEQFIGMIYIRTFFRCLVGSLVKMSFNDRKRRRQIGVTQFSMLSTRLYFIGNCFLCFSVFILTTRKVHRKCEWKGKKEEVIMHFCFGVFSCRFDVEKHETAIVKSDDGRKLRVAKVETSLMSWARKNFTSWKLSIFKY